MADVRDSHEAWQAFRLETLDSFWDLVVHLSGDRKIRLAFADLRPDEVQALLFHALYYDFIHDQFDGKVNTSRVGFSSYIGLLGHAGLSRPSCTTKLDATCPPLNTDDIISIGFFHRHPEFLQEVSKNIRIREVDVTRWTRRPKLGETIPWIYKLRLPRTSIQLARLVSAARTLGSIRTFPRVVLTSGHALYGNRYGDGGSIRNWMAYAKVRGSLVVALQPGFVHGFASYIDQVEYEGRLADTYLAWGEISSQMPAHKYDFGSLYGARNIQSTCEPGRQVVLPQVPANSSPRPISFYWSMTRASFVSEMPHIEHFLLTLPNEQGLTLRCKSVDSPFYCQLSRVQGLQQFQLDSGDVNASGTPKSHEENWVLYPSTALVELNPQSDIHLRLIPALGSFYPNEEKCFKSIHSVSATTGSRLLQEELLSRIRRVTPMQGAQRLLQYLESIGAVDPTRPPTS